MSVKLLTEQHLEFLSLKADCTGSSESTLVKMTHFWKSHVAAQKFYNFGQRRVKPALTSPVLHFVVVLHDEA